MPISYRPGNAAVIEDALARFDAGKMPLHALCQVEDSVIALPAFEMSDRPWTGAVLLSRLRAIEASENPRAQLRDLIRLVETPVVVLGEHVREPRLRRLFRRYTGLSPTRSPTGGAS